MSGGATPSLCVGCFRPSTNDLNQELLRSTFMFSVLGVPVIMVPKTPIPISLPQVWLWFSLCSSSNVFYLKVQSFILLAATYLYCLCGAKRPRSGVAAGPPLAVTVLQCTPGKVNLAFRAPPSPSLSPDQKYLRRIVLME